MKTDRNPELTQLLMQWEAGDSEAPAALFEAMYAELKQSARSMLHSMWSSKVDVSATILVHECFMKMHGNAINNITNRNHFRLICARAMRQVYIDALRAANAGKREWKDINQITLGGVSDPQQLAPERISDFLDLLDQIESDHPRLLNVITCRLFAGMDNDEVANALDINVRTAQRDWAKARGLFAATLGQ